MEGEEGIFPLFQLFLVDANDTVGFHLDRTLKISGHTLMHTPDTVFTVDILGRRGLLSHEKHEHGVSQERKK